MGGILYHIHFCMVSSALCKSIKGDFIWGLEINYYVQQGD